MLPPRSIPNTHSTRSANGNGNNNGGIIHPDDAIRQTDDDAASSRASAISLGYLNDSFNSLLYKPSFHPTPNQPGPSTSTNRKPPLINIGTHHRTVGIDTLVDQFLSTNEGGQKQVVSLGAGSDTRFWRLMSQPNPPNISKYVEIDFPHLTSPKAHRISRSKKLSSILVPPTTSSPTTPPTHLASNSSASTSSTTPYKISQGGTRLDSDPYTLLPLDLRPNSTQTISEILTENLLPLLNPEIPTLLLAECLFPYMPPEDSENIIRWFGENFKQCVGVVYEMSGLGDSFGKVMKRNLASRNLSIPGSEPFPTPQSQAERFIDPKLDDGKFDICGVKNLWEVRERVIDPNELQRISKLEFLDEIEELKLVLEHYVIAWGVKGDQLRNVGL